MLGSHLTKILDNAFGGTALTLFLCCVSPSMENAEQTLDVLHKAKSASNIYNYPKVNLSPDEEISVITGKCQRSLLIPLNWFKNLMFSTLLCID